MFNLRCNMNVATGAVIGLSLVAAGTYFAISNIYPLTTADFNSSQQLINPNGPEVQFVLFTRENAPYGLDPQFNGSFNESGFNFENPTKIITHGFMSSIKYDVFMLIKNAFLETGAYNVIGMDWSALCHVEYASAMHGAKIAGKQLGDFLNWLTSNGVNLSDIHIIGHSLGAHVAGIGADVVQDGRVARITDPAGPGYGDIKEELKLDPQDAMLVDVVHTFMKVIGTARPSGHVDFYPNGGKYQPGCPDLTSCNATHQQHFVQPRKVFSTVCGVHQKSPRVQKQTVPGIGGRSVQSLFAGHGGLHGPRKQLPNWALLFQNQEPISLFNECNRHLKPY
ncbi:phospholipase A1 member A isoform X2 [Dendroctonus ponderosae]|uniref:phospholipase A1 member A isoform X2 n=1 Tax=Dendroctonus ponderosae TaxID=77166 RepID=UPI00203538F8|nr:phospholipase A1 member A isoform X2 [Dendroctonus ponderosae]